MGSRGVLNQRQREILIGTLLGDAHLEQNGRYVRLKVDHYGQQKGYVFWMAREFEPFSLKPREIFERDKRNGKIYKRWHFSTRSLAIFEEFKNLFYAQKKKVIPECIDDLITDQSLAVWYMDDGYKRKDCKGLYLCTSSFTNREQEMLQKVLWNKFKLMTKVHYQHCLAKIFVPSVSADRFNTLVKPYILPVFRYKLL